MQMAQSYYPMPTVPIPGVTSGMIPSGMNYEKLPSSSHMTLPNSRAPQPGPRPLQQWVREQPNARHGHAIGFEVGTPVRICHLVSRDMSRYNGLIGDITATHTVDGSNGTSEFLFDVRCPCQGEGQGPPSNVQRDPAHSRVPYSAMSKMGAIANRRKMAPLFGVTEMEASGPLQSSEATQHFH
ncbi:unnamed protein product [Polarella glacialis]|uniref:Uncharacterized protein n=1 Tax=Polarella glacialis TaxID=89957 RepID=A0A813HK31_POLGL|nr:unnamed protein product [Polarella glacialis]